MRLYDARVRPLDSSAVRSARFHESRDLVVGRLVAQSLLEVAPLGEVADQVGHERPPAGLPRRRAHLDVHDPAVGPAPLELVDGT